MSMDQHKVLLFAQICRGEVDTHASTAEAGSSSRHVVLKCGSGGDGGGGLCLELEAKPFGMEI